MGTHIVKRPNSAIRPAYDEDRHTANLNRLDRAWFRYLAIRRSEDPGPLENAAIFQLQPILGNERCPRKPRWFFDRRKGSLQPNLAKDTFDFAKNRCVPIDIGTGYHCVSHGRRASGTTKQGADKHR